MANKPNLLTERQLVEKLVATLPAEVQAFWLRCSYLGRFFFLPGDSVGIFRRAQHSGSAKLVSALKFERVEFHPTKGAIFHMQLPDGAKVQLGNIPEKLLGLPLLVWLPLSDAVKIVPGHGTLALGLNICYRSLGRPDTETALEEFFFLRRL